MRTAARCKLFIRATSLGGAHSLIEHRASSEGRARARRKICCGSRSVSNTRTISSPTGAGTSMKYLALALMLLSLPAAVRLRSRKLKLS
jgi:hypothetical protein